MARDAIRDAALKLLPPIFRRCLGGDGLYSLGVPGLIRDYVYATDGRICVRMPATPEIRTAVEAIPRDGRYPKADDAFDLTPREPCVYHLAAAVICDAPTCKACRGTGSVEMDECPCCGYEVRGTGRCNDCDGCGLAEDGSDGTCRQGMVVGGKAMLAYTYLKVLAAAHAKMQFAAEDPHKKAVYFTTPEGVEGVLMPMVMES